MKKNTLTSFINKYSLNCSIITSKWTVDEMNKTIQTYTVSDDKSAACNVTLSYDSDNLDSGELGIYDTVKLQKLLSVLDEDIEMSYINNNNKIRALNLESNNTSVQYVTADISVIPKSHKIVRDFDYTLEIPIDKNFISKFIKAKNALLDEKNFALIPAKKSKSKKIQLIVGYDKSINTTKILIDIEPNPDKNVLNKIMVFNAKNLKEIFSSNSEFDNATLKVCEDGILYVEFINDTFACRYHLVEMKGIN